MTLFAVRLGGRCSLADERCRSLLDVFVGCCWLLLVDRGCCWLFVLRLLMFVVRCSWCVVCGLLLSVVCSLLIAVLYCALVDDWCRLVFLGLVYRLLFAFVVC